MFVFLSPAQSTVLSMGHRETKQNENVYVLGGGIGAGKSTVLEEFAKAGFAVIQADFIGHDVLAAVTPSGRQVMARWPEVVADGEVDRPALAEIVFNDPAALGELESITHPAIQDGIFSAVEEALADTSMRGAIIEVPLLRVLPHSDWAHIAVVAPEDLRVSRAVERGADEADIRARIANQEPDEAWAEWADVIVDNGGSLSETLEAVARIIEGSSALGVPGRIRARGIARDGDNEADTE